MLEGTRTLHTLKIELLFLKLRGYGPRCAVPEHFFEDSPSCLRHNCGGACSDCPLIEFVPPDRRSEEPACRGIPLDNNGMTLDVLYMCGDSRETEDAVENWLEKRIEQLEKERPESERMESEKIPTDARTLASSPRLMPITPR